MTTVPLKLARTGLDEAFYALLATRAGVLAPMLPHKAAKIAAGFRKYGGLGALPLLASVRYADRAAVIDELGTLTFRELEDQVNAVANAWRARGLEPGEGVAILARNHRLFLVAVFAAARCGARIVLLNTDFAGPQIREVAGREGTDLLVHDDEYAHLLEGVDPPRGRFRAWTDAPGDDTLDALIAGGDTTPAPSAGVHPKIILLTSGTTGTPKGAPRPEPRSLAPLGALLSKVPIRAKEITECPAPIFHTLGFAHTVMAVAFGSTLVLRRRFDPVAVLDSLEQNQATMLVVVPVMLQRMLDAPGGFDVARSFPHLRIIFVAGSQLGAELARRSLEAFGPVVYNMYGSTEVAYATVATPQDLAVEPGCVGSPVRGAMVKILDEDGKELPRGATGRIFVGNSAQFEGYTGGGGKEVIDGLMSSGDVGHFDLDGRLFIDGRDDDMIVSGGENVFPGEIEELLAAHPAVEEVSVIGVPDEKYGQRLAAFVVRRDAASLTEDDVKDHVKQNLARYKTPRDVHFLDQLPRNPTGKVLKRELREMATDG